MAYQQFTLKLTICVILPASAFAIGRLSAPIEPIDAGSLAEIRAEAAMELYDAVDECASDLCLETFSAMAQKDVVTK